MVLTVQLAPLVPRELRVSTALMVHKVLLDLLGHKVLRAQPA